MVSFIKGQMHHHDDLGSKCAYMCHLSNKTTRKSVLLSTPQIWLMKVSKKTGLRLGIEADIAGQLCTISGRRWLPIMLLIGWEISVAGSDCHWYLSTNQNLALICALACNVSLYAQTEASFLLTLISHIWGVLRRTDLRVVLFERWHV